LSPAPDPAGAGKRASEGQATIDFTVSIGVTLRIDVAASAAYVRLAGDVDLAGEPELSTVVSQLTAAGCREVEVNLADVTFAGTSLLNFLARTAVHGHARIAVSGANALLRHLIELSGLGTVVEVITDGTQCHR
jgi:anti-anti-sigma factor